MMQIPANLAQRIIEAARIAAAIHEEQSLAQAGSRLQTGGVGLNVSNHDIQSAGGAAIAQDRLRTRLR